MQLLQSVILSPIPRQDAILKRVVGAELEKHERLSVKGGEFSYYNWDAVLKKIDTLKHVNVYLYRNYRCDIVEKLKGIFFEELKELDLSSNNIMSLTPIVDLRCPLLEGLNLEDNLIIQLRSLRKANFRLSKLRLGGNPMRQLSKLQWISFAPKLQLFLFNYVDSPGVHVPLGNVMKVQSKVLVSLRGHRLFAPKNIEQAIKARQPAQLDGQKIKPTAM